MKQELLLKAFGDIDESFISEAYLPIPVDASGTSGRIVHMKKKRIITFALAAALILALGITAYAGRTVFGWGGNMEIRTTDTDNGEETVVYVHTEDLKEPVSFENGHMYFIVNDEHIDITDRVSETQPYIYDYTDEEGVIHYWIIGKNGNELEHYGFAEYLQPPEGSWTAGYVARTNNNSAPWLDNAVKELGFDFEPDS